MNFTPSFQNTIERIVDTPQKTIRKQRSPNLRQIIDRNKNAILKIITKLEGDKEKYKDDIRIKDHLVVMKTFFSNNLHAFSEFTNKML